MNEADAYLELQDELSECKCVLKRIETLIIESNYNPFDATAAQRTLNKIMLELKYLSL